MSEMDDLLQVAAEARSRRRAARKRARDEQRAFVAKHTPPGFDPEREAELVAERGAFRRLCRDLAALPSPAELIARHGESLHERPVEHARAAHAWLTDFLEQWDSPQARAGDARLGDVSEHGR